MKLLLLFGLFIALVFLSGCSMCDGKFYDPDTYVCKYSGSGFEYLESKADIERKANETMAHQDRVNEEFRNA